MYDFHSRLAKIVPDSEQAGDFFYDSATILWSLELNREPSLSGNLLSFQDWDEFDKFAHSIPKEETWERLFKRASTIYEYTYRTYLKKEGVSKVTEVAIKLTNALDKLVGNHKLIEEIQEETLILCQNYGDSLCSGRILMSQAHFAAFSLYNYPLAFQKIHQAQEAFCKSKNDELEHWAYQLELTLLEADRMEGAYANLDRVEWIYRKCEGFFEIGNQHENLINFYNRMHQIYLLYKRLDLMSDVLLKLLKVVNEHFPDQYERNLTAVKSIFEKYSLNFPK